MAECTHLERTSMYFDGELPAADEAEALAHVTTCVECQTLLGDAVAIDAALSRVARANAVIADLGEATTTAASGTMPASPNRRRRWAIAIAAGVLAAAAILFLVLRPRDLAEPQRPAVLVVAPKRAVEARFTGATFAAHRPYEASPDRAHEPIAMDAVAALEKRGDVRDAVAALASAGELVRAEQLAEAAPTTADAQSDLAAIALASGDVERALEHAYQALAVDPQHAAATWNLALATRQLRLWRTSRAAFATIAAKSEPGWAAEATAQIAALDRQLGAPGAIAALHEQFRVLVKAGSVRNTILDPGDDIVEFQRRSKSIMEDETPISLADVRRFPSSAWLFLYESLGSATPDIVEGLVPVAHVLDDASGTTGATAATKRAVAEKAAIARVAVLVQAGLGGDPPAAEVAELERLAAPWRDPFVDLVIAREKNDTTAIDRCTKDVFALPCLGIAQDAVLAATSVGPRETLGAMEQARDFALAVGETPDYGVLSHLHEQAGRRALARAEADEDKRILPTP